MLLHLVKLNDHLTKIFPKIVVKSKRKCMTTIINFLSASQDKNIFGQKVAVIKEHQSPVARDTKDF
jgi:hypothetical protein